MKIGIILGSTREGRASKDVGDWVLKNSANIDAKYEIIDISDFNLPFYGTSEDQTNINNWNKAIDQYDGFIFVVPELGSGFASTTFT